MNIILYPLINMVKANSDLNEIKLSGSEVIKHTHFACWFY